MYVCGTNQGGLSWDSSPPTWFVPPTKKVISMQRTWLVCHTCQKSQHNNITEKCPSRRGEQFKAPC